MSNSLHVNPGKGIERIYHFWETRVMTSSRTEVTYYFFLPDHAAVRHEVKRLDEGSHVLSIREKRHARWQREYFSREYKKSFLQSMLLHIDVDASPGTALQRVIESERNPRKRIDLEPALQILKGGGTFSDAIEAVDIFDKPIIAMLKAGETSGLKTAVLDSIELLHSREGVLSTFLSVLWRLMRDILLALTSVFGVQFFVFPYLEKSAPQGGDPVKLKQYADAIHDGYFYNGILVWIALVIGTAFLVSLIAMLISKSVRDRASESLIRVPIVRSMILDSLLSDSFLLLSRMLTVDITQINAINILAAVAPMAAVRRLWENIRASIGNGDSFARAIRDQRVLREDETKVLNAYHNNEHLAKILLAMSKNRRIAAEKSTNRFKAVVTFATFTYIAASIAVVILVMRVQDMGTAIGFETLMK